MSVTFHPALNTRYSKDNCVLELIREYLRLFLNALRAAVYSVEMIPAARMTVLCWSGTSSVTAGDRVERGGGVASGQEGCYNPVF